MPDMMLPQVPPSPAPTKPSQAQAQSPSRAPETKAETESDQGFSNVLKTRMQPEKEAAQTDTDVRESAEEASGGEVPVEAAAGNPLPPGGNVVVPTLAALDPLMQNLEAAVRPEETAEPPAVETLIVIPSLPGGATAAPTDPTQAAAPAVTKQQPAALEAWQLRGGPWKTGVAELPDSAQTAVAQAVRSAVAELDETTPQTLAMERFGAEVRTAATAMATARPSVMESMLDRLTAAASQPATSAGSALPQGIQTAAAQDAATTRPALPTTTVETPLRQPGWDQALSERVLWVANQKFQGAEIKLNPANLGPIEVRVQLHHDQAQISFTAQHAPAREALEAALPRLREMFSANGYELVDVNVSQHSFADQQRHTQGFEERFQTTGRGEDTLETGPGSSVMTGRMTGLPSSAIDLFA